MNPSQSSERGNVVRFRKRSGDHRAPLDDAKSDDILRMLDLSKFERDRRTAGHGISMRSNIAAMILLGLLVFVAAEDFSRLEQANLCFDKSECSN